MTLEDAMTGSSIWLAAAAAFGRAKIPGGRATQKPNSNAP